MRNVKEKVQTKLNSMASILLDDIIVVGEKRQEGTESIVASFYDKEGNKFTFNLSLTITPEEIEQVTPAPTLSEQVNSILEEIGALKNDISTLKGYHTTIEVDTPNEEQQTEENQNMNEENNNSQTDDQHE